VVLHHKNHDVLDLRQPVGSGWLGRIRSLPWPGSLHPLVSPVQMLALDTFPYGPAAHA
jgi:hypothetical protein